MSAIATYLKVLLDAEYGEQVRQAIIDAISQCYLDATAGMVPEFTVESATGGHNLVITTGGHVETIFIANGDVGPSPTVTLQNTSTGVKIKVVAADGQTTSSVEVSNGMATDAQVSAWLTAHPEATTTVTDGSVTTAKLAKGAVTTDKIDDGAVGREKIVKNYIPIEAYSGDPYTVNGITFTRNSDGSITMEGVATDDAVYELISFNQNFYLPEGYYTISCSPDSDVEYATGPGGIQIPTSWDYQIEAEQVSAGSDPVHYTYNIFGGETDTFNALVAHGKFRMVVTVASGTDYSTPLTIYPMLQRGKCATEYMDPRFSFDYFLEQIDNQNAALANCYTKAEIDAMLASVDIGLTSAQIATLTGLLD